MYYPLHRPSIKKFSLIANLAVLGSGTGGLCRQGLLATSVINPFFTGPDSAVLYLVGDTACTGYVENPNSTYYQTFGVSPSQPTIIKIPKSEIQFEFDLSSIQAKGVHISTTRNVYAFIQNSNMDIFQSYPTSSISDPCPFTKNTLLFPVYYWETSIIYHNVFL